MTKRNEDARIYSFTAKELEQFAECYADRARHFRRLAKHAERVTTSGFHEILMDAHSTCWCGERHAAAETGKRSPLNPDSKSGHYVSEDDSPCWCGDRHYYAPRTCVCDPEVPR